MKPALGQLELVFTPPKPSPALLNDKRAREQEMLRLLSDLEGEFDRLNSLHLSGKYRCPKIEFSTLKSFGGYYQKQRHRIVLSWQAYVEHGWEETLNTFRHEVAHIVHLHHRAEFWELAYQLGVTKKYAANPIVPKKRAGKIYVYMCPNCQGKVHRKRRLRMSSCGKCDKAYNPAYKLKLVSVEGS
jgi:predicted SprT family Zn-dependent metalloprotease